MEASSRSSLASRRCRKIATFRTSGGGLFCRRIPSSWRTVTLLSILTMLSSSRVVVSFLNVPNGSVPRRFRQSRSAYPVQASFSSICTVGRHPKSLTSTLLHAERRRVSSATSTNAMDASLFDSTSGYRRPTVQWYPGHIAKAERQLAETLKAVDVVVEVRDARACKATSHPKVGEWCAGRPRIVVMTHVDAIPKLSLQQWKQSYESLGAGRWDAAVNLQVRHQALQAAMERQKYAPEALKRLSKLSTKSAATPLHVVSPVENVLFVNAKQGQGTHSITRAVLKAGAHVQERRERRGLKERALRVGVIGYPNVGKSALINRLLGRKRARTANTPGVTRSLQWIRVKAEETKTKRKEFELLDSPGIIPANLVDQNDAALLAVCNCIGQAAYDNQAIAAFLCEWLKTLHLMGKGRVTSPKWPRKCKERYGFDPLEPIERNDEFQPSQQGNGDDNKRYQTGEDMLFSAADNVCRGNQEDAARKIIQDFRAGRLGPISLQLAPETDDDEGQQKVQLEQESSQEEWRKQREEESMRERQERAQAAMETAKQQGLELPPMVEHKSDNTSDTDDEAEVGKGLFDGW